MNVMRGLYFEMLQISSKGVYNYFHWLIESFTGYCIWTDTELISIYNISVV